MKQPLQTSIAIDRLDFEEFEVEEKIHVGVSVKDFRAVIIHAESLRASIAAHYSQPSRPLQLSYNEHGMRCEFTLMTIGEYRGASVTPAPTINRTSHTHAGSGSTGPSRTQRIQPQPMTMAPPIQPASRSFTRDSARHNLPRPSPPPPQASIDQESLFVQEDDENDHQWDEKPFDDEDDVRWVRTRDINLTFTHIIAGP